MAVTEEQVDEWDSKVRFLQFQTKKLHDDFERHKRLQAMGTHPISFLSFSSSFHAHVLVV